MLTNWGCNGFLRGWIRGSTGAELSENGISLFCFCDGTSPTNGAGIERHLLKKWEVIDLVDFLPVVAFRMRLRGRRGRKCIQRRHGCETISPFSVSLMLLSILGECIARLFGERWGYVRRTWIWRRVSVEGWMDRWVGQWMDGWMDGWMRIMRHESLIVYFWRNIYLESDVSCKGGNTSRLPKYEILIVV